MQAQAVEVCDLVSETVTFWRPGADSPILKSLKDLDTSPAESCRLYAENLAENWITLTLQTKDSLGAMPASRMDTTAMDEDWASECGRALDLMRLVPDSQPAEERAAKCLVEAVLGSSASTVSSDSESCSESLCCEDVAQEVVEDFLRRAVSLLSGLTDATDLSRSCASLDRFAQTRLGSLYMSRSIDSAFLEEALRGYPTPVRRLLGRQVRRMMAEASIGAAKKVGLVRGLGPFLVQEEDVGVAEILESCVSAAAGAVASADDGEGALEEIVDSLEYLLGNPSAWGTADLRVVGRLLEVAAMGKGAFAKLCKPGGVLDAIRDALREAPLDELLAISLLERLEFVSLRDAGVGGLKAALTFLDRTEPALTALVEREDLLVMTRCSSMRVLATLQSLRCAGEPGFQVSAGFLGKVVEIFEGAAVTDTELVRSAVDALNGFLHANAAGLHSALGQDSGASIASILARHALVGSDFDSSVQEVALRTLSSFVGRGGDVGGVRTAIFAALSEAAGLTLSTALARALAKPEEEVREAAYDLARELAGAGAWGPAELCAGDGLVRRIADPKSELVPKMATARYRCACRLFEAFSEVEATPESSLKLLSDSVKAGPYGSGVRVVGTESL